MSTTESQQNVDAIRKILFGQEQQQLEQKIDELRQLLGQLQIVQHTQRKEQETLTATLGQTAQELHVRIETQISNLNASLTGIHKAGIASVQQNSNAQAEQFQKALHVLHADTTSKLTDFGKQTGSQTHELKTSLEQATARIAKLEASEQAFKKVLAKSLTDTLNFLNDQK